MKFDQKLSLEDYHLYLKETLYANPIFKMIVGTGVILLLLVLYMYINNGFVYKDSMNGLLAITILVLMIRKITHFSDKRRFNKNDYMHTLLANHVITFSNELIKIKKGKDSYTLEKNEEIYFTEFPNFLVLTLSGKNKFPIKMTNMNESEQNEIKEIIENHNKNIEADSV